MAKFKRYSINDDIPRLPTQNRRDAEYLKHIFREEGIPEDHIWTTDRIEQKMMEPLPEYSNPTEHDIKEMLQMFAEITMENLGDSVASMKIVADSFGDLDPHGEAEKNILALMENLQKIQQMLHEEVQAVLLRRTLKSVD